MVNRKHLRKRLRENPQFFKWLKAKPELYNKCKQDPSVLEGMIVSWRKEQNKQAQLQKIGQGYRQVVSQIQELNTLIERVDDLMSNVKKMNDKWSEYREQLISKDTVTNASLKRRKNKSAIN